ncbi:MAG: DUF4270 domain-containing protein [Bacteroidales bacterium]|nr:DUF4270 domain-containing protein [Bacteroidales bacterium]
MRSLPKLLLRSVWISLLIVFVVVSCKKDPYELGIDLVPPTDTLYVNLFDTVTIQAYSVLEDSMRTDEMSSFVLGSIVDPIFGKTTAGFYTQFLLSSEEADFGINPQLDSLVLMLYYTDGYGDTNTLQQIRVFEMSEDLIYDSSYYSNQSAGTYGLELANITYMPRPRDSVSLYGIKVAPHLRINLSNKTNYLGNKILYAPENVLSKTAEFLKFMKGLHVEAMPVNSRGSLVNFASSDGLSAMILYFHNDDKGDSLHFTMPIDKVAARFNTFNHHGYQEASPEFKQQVLYHDTILGKNQLFLQSMGGVKIKLKLPYIKSLRELGTIAINSAVLSFKNPSRDTIWHPPPQLAMFKVDTAGRLGVLIDEVEGEDYFGGAYNKDDRSYWFRLTRHIQRMLLYDTIENYNLYIYASSPLARTPQASRVELNGTSPFFASSPGDNLKLTITYTKK